MGRMNDLAIYADELGLSVETAGKLIGRSVQTIHESMDKDFMMMAGLVEKVETTRNKDNRSIWLNAFETCADASFDRTNAMCLFCVDVGLLPQEKGDAIIAEGKARFIEKHRKATMSKI